MKRLCVCLLLGARGRREAKQAAARRRRLFAGAYEGDRSARALWGCGGDREAPAPCPEGAAVASPWLD